MGGRLLARLDFGPCPNQEIEFRLELRHAFELHVELRAHFVGEELDRFLQPLNIGVGDRV